ncbi:WD40 repeat domain-containing protein [Streptomyces sp. enrichment culture]|uniref:WD40 repeat domain-containing protein n=1 Tax=Streptomyces sp. enrichment culture TaxID=1795815 RepID=UPI003F54D254
MEGAVAKTAEDAYRQFTQAQAVVARRLLLRMVAPGEGTPDTRRPADRGELESHGRQETADVLEALTRARLLTLDGDTVELAHEALLTAWPRLRGWIEQDREHLRVHRKLTEAARAWEELGCDVGALYRGSRLATALEHFGSSPREDLTALEHDFLTASTTARDQEERAAALITRRLRRLSAALSVLLGPALTASLIAWHQSRNSDQQRQAADSARKVALSRQLTAQSAALIGTNSDLASLLAIHAYRTSPTSPAMESLHTAATVPLRNRLTVHRGAVVSVAFSPDGRTLATGSDRGAELWDAATGRFRRSVGKRTDVVVSVAFSPDGRTLATGSDSSVRLWDVASGSTLATLAGHTDTVYSAAFSPDGRTLATGSLDRTARLWDTANGSSEAILSGPLREVFSMAFAPRGRTLATASDRRGVDLWDTENRRIRSRVSRGSEEADVVTFSPDGRTLATARYNRQQDLPRRPPRPHRAGTHDLPAGPATKSRVSGLSQNLRDGIDVPVDVR